MVRPGVTTRKPRVNCRAAGPAHGVDGLPGDDHRHDGGLAGAGGQLQGQTHQLRVGVVVGVGEVLEKPLAGLAQLRGDLGQPDRGLDGFDLAEERPDAAELVVTPVLEETRGFGRHLPVVGIRQTPPLVDVMAEFVDDGGRVVLLVLGRFACQNQAPAGSPFLPLSGLGIGVMNSARRRVSMICCVGWPWSSSSQCRGRVLVWRVENRPFEELIVHATRELRST